MLVSLGIDAVSNPKFIPSMADAHRFLLSLRSSTDSAIVIQPWFEKDSSRPLLVVKSFPMDERGAPNINKSSFD